MTKLKVFSEKGRMWDKGLLHPLNMWISASGVLYCGAKEHRSRSGERSSIRNARGKHVLPGSSDFSSPGLLSSRSVPKDVISFLALASVIWSQHNLWLCLYDNKQAFGERWNPRAGLGLHSGSFILGNKFVFRAKILCTELRISETIWRTQEEFMRKGQDKRRFFLGEISQNSWSDLDLLSHGPCRTWRLEDFLTQGSQNDQCID